MDNYSVHSNYWIRMRDKTVFWKSNLDLLEFGLNAIPKLLHSASSPCLSFASMWFSSVLFNEPEDLVVQLYVVFLDLS